MKQYAFALGMALTVLAVGCTSSGTSTTEEPNAVAGAAPTTTSLRAGQSGAIGWRVFDVDGVEVVALLAEGQDLPEQARVVEFTTTIIDPGTGPMLCLGAIKSSLPPQCGGLLLDGLDFTGWAKESQGVRWGDRAVQVSWPPRDGHVTVLAHGEPEYVEREYPSDSRPPAERSFDEQMDIQDQLSRHLRTLGVSFTLYPAPGGRVNVGVGVADRETVRQIAALVDDPTSLRISGHAIILQP